MNHGWEKKRLGELALIKYGFPFDSKKFNSDCDGMPLIRIRDVVPGRTSTYYNGEFSDDYIIKTGDYLIGMDGEFNIARWNSENALLNQRVCQVVSVDYNVLLNQFLFYFLLIELKRIEEHTPFVTVKHLSATTLNNIISPVPPINLQNHIVLELDKLNELIEIKRKQLKDLDALTQSLFYETFGEPFLNSMGWPIMSFGELASSINYGTSLPATDGGKYPYIRMNNLTDNGYLDLSNLKYIDIPSSELDKCLVKKGDILFNRTNSREKVGKTALFDRTEEMVIAGYIIRVRTKEGLLNPIFAVRYMNLPELKEHLRKICRGAVNQANINSKEMASIPFLVPPIELQNQYALKIEAVEAQKRLIESSIVDLETLLASRMDYWFNE